METFWTLLYVLPAVVTAITVSSNGNSPEVKMLGGVMVDMQEGFTPMTTPKTDDAKTVDSRKENAIKLNNTKLSVNERYRRLIPYMTFYYANDLPQTSKETFTKNVEIDKAEIVEAAIARQKNKPYNRNIPRYQGNRISNYNWQSNHPTKVYKEVRPVYHDQRYIKHYIPQHNDHYLDGLAYKKVIFKPSKAPSAPFSLPSRKPPVDYYHSSDNYSNGPFYQYVPEKELPPKYKLIPYEQTPPIQIVHDNYYFEKQKPIPVPVLVSKEPVYSKPGSLVRPQYSYESVFNQQHLRNPITVTESYYEKLQPQQHEVVNSAIENGFKPILVSTEVPVSVTPTSEYVSENQQIMVETVTSSGIIEKPEQNYYPYIVEEPIDKPTVTNTMTAGSFLDSVKLQKPIPKPATQENMDTSIRTLLQMLNVLKVVPQQNELESVELSTKIPSATPKIITIEEQYETTATRPTQPAPVSEEAEFQEESYLAAINPPSQHIDEYHPVRGTSQRFPLQISSDDEGGTPGRPGIDYPTLTVIPPTKFDCKTQRYKGFFADPETRCQVWHYCDLNGGQASFLCPNGTIFSQAGLTCDWWFNVRCASTTQLYVLNESLYKYILPHSPKFPEDYSGPLVDKYLTLKFKEMEEQFKKNKNKKTSEDKDDEDDVEEVEPEAELGHPTLEMAPSTPIAAPEMADVSESSVSVQNPGSTGNVERLQE